MTNVLYVGNFEPDHSTENHVRRALKNNHHEVWFMQENDPMTFFMLANNDDVFNEIEMVLWTRTGWDWDRFYTGGEQQALADQRTMLRRCRNLGIPTVGYHLDIWWGLKREHQVTTEPFFEVDMLVTADGGHDDRWKEKHINHFWLPPGISRDEAKVGKMNSNFVTDIAFVGSWQGGYHEESAHRRELVQFLMREFRSRTAFYPEPGQHAVRGKPLQDLYKSAKILVGDSCFTGTGLANYWSDRVPETLGRGGLLLHPDVPGLDDHFTDGLDLLTWTAFDWQALGSQIERALGDEKLREEIKKHGRKTVLAKHTYETRMDQVMAEMKVRGLL